MQEKLQNKSLFEYAVIRFLPRVDREEFMNVGIILYCHESKFLQVAYEINETKISSFCTNCKDIAINEFMGELKEHLQAFTEICSGNENSGAIGKLSIKERFRWLTAPRSTILQISPIHTGFFSGTKDAGEMLAHLLDTLVR